MAGNGPNYIFSHEVQSSASGTSVLSNNSIVGIPGPSTTYANSMQEHVRMVDTGQPDCQFMNVVPQSNYSNTGGTIPPLPFTSSCSMMPNLPTYTNSVVNTIRSIPNNASDDVGQCIVCNTVHSSLAQHMLSHSKEEMISALIGKPSRPAEVKSQPPHLLTPGPSSFVSTSPHPSTGLFPEVKTSLPAVSSSSGESCGLTMVLSAPMPTMLAQQPSPAFLNFGHSQAHTAQSQIIVNQDAAVYFKNISPVVNNSSQFFHNDSSSLVNQLQFLQPVSHQQLLLTREQKLQQHQLQQQQQPSQYQLPTASVKSSIPPRFIFLGNTNGKAIVSPISSNVLLNNAYPAGSFLMGNQVASNNTLPSSSSISRVGNAAMFTAARPSLCEQTNVNAASMQSFIACNVSGNLPQPPSYQTAIRNSMLANQQRCGVITNNNVTDSRSLHSNNRPVSSAAAIPSSCLFSPRGSNSSNTTTWTKENATGNPGTANSKRGDVQDITTIQIGENIKISVPKDMADKRERLQQLINEELVRGIILNDTKLGVVQCATDGSSQFQETGVHVAQTAPCLAKTEPVYSKRYSTPNEMKIELFEERPEALEHEETSLQSFSDSDCHSSDSNFIKAAGNSFLKDGNKKQREEVVEPISTVNLRSINSDNPMCNSSEKIYVSDVKTPQPEPFCGQSSAVSRVPECDPLSITTQNNRSDSVSWPSTSGNSASNPKNPLTKPKSYPTTRHWNRNHKANLFATSFTDLIKNGCSSDNLRVPRHEHPSNSGPFPSGSFSFKVVPINETDKLEDHQYAALEVKVSLQQF